MTVTAGPIVAATPPPSGDPLAAAAVALTRALIRLDTANTPGGSEAAAVALLARRLTAAGGRPEVLAGRPGRDNLVLRVSGRRPGPGVVVHAHLDTVPPDPLAWSVDPWGGLLRDGCVWGVGAVDMKSTAAMMAAVAADWLHADVRPEHDVVFAFLADEEAGGTWGARWLTRERPDLFAGCDTAIGEVGGFAVPLRAGTTLYPVMTAERGHALVELSATGRGGHSGAADAPADNPLLRVAAAVTAVGAHAFSAFEGVAAAAFVRAAATAVGLPATLPPRVARAMLGSLVTLVEPGTRGSAVPTEFRAGQAPNVTPHRATATLDCRFVPGHWEEFRAELFALLPAGVLATATVLSPGFDRDLDGRVVPALTAALRRADPGAVAVPYGVAASTDGPAFAEIGLIPIGFTPLGLPAGFPYGRLFHGPDERVPVAAIEFGVRVLSDFLATVGSA